MSTVFLNDKYLDKDQAKVSVLDRGFIFADGVYEVFPVYNGFIFRCDEHLKRLQNSLDAIHIDNPYKNNEWKDILSNVVKRNDNGDQSLYLQVTRGVAERDHVFSENMTPTVFAMSRPLTKKTNHEGVAIITTEDIRWKFCDIKSIALLPGVLLKYDAHKKGAKEAVLINKNGLLTEGAASNVFIVKDNKIKTPKKDHQLLPGITRDLVVELASKNSLPIHEMDITENELKSADEIWLTSSTQEIIPVIKINDQSVGDGKVGKMWHQINTIYQEFKRDFSGEDL